MQAGERSVTCPSCDQVHHQECWSEVGGCGTYGCKQAPKIDKSEATSAAPLTAWGDTKKCPACGTETVKPEDSVWTLCPNRRGCPGQNFQLVKHFLGRVEEQALPQMRAAQWREGLCERSLHDVTFSSSGDD
jgi:hypothetical protein